MKNNTINEKHLKDFCEAYNINFDKASGNTVCPNGKEDKYIVNISGPSKKIESLVIKRKGRFGNNVFQLYNAIAIAKKIGANQVYAGDLETFITNEMFDKVKINGIQIIRDNTQDNLKNYLAGHFYYPFTFYPILNNIDSKESCQIFSDIRHKIMGIDQNECGVSDKLHVHIRSGDIFTHKVHPLYVQPPLSFYKKAISDKLMTNQYSGLSIVFQDYNNPIIKPLIRDCEKKKIPIGTTSSTLKSDIKELLKSKTIISSFGSFIPMIGCLSGKMHEICYFRDMMFFGKILNDLGIKATKYIDIDCNYIQPGTWDNTSSQRKMMLTYPEKNIIQQNNKLSTINNITFSTYDTNAKIAQAKYHYQQKDFKASLRILFELQRSNPENENILNDIGTVLFAKGNIDDSISCMISAYKINKRNKHVIRNLNHILRSPTLSDSQRKVILNEMHGDKTVVPQKEIDFVIPWVDGCDAEHIAKRREYEIQNQQNHGLLEERATGDVRFKHNNELKYCLRSIIKYAPWFRKIWIITDGQIPNFFNLSSNKTNKIQIIDHKEIFSDYEQYLPTFNSRTITSMLWRIPGLCENFIYLNDDWFFSDNLKPEDFFKDNKVILRGEWSNSACIKEKLSLYRNGVINGAEMFGFNKNEYFATTHTPVPMKLSWCEHFYKKYHSQFVENIGYKFRHRDQYLFESAISHFAIKNKFAIPKPAHDHIHFSVDFCKNALERKTELFLYMYLIMSKKIKTFCINDYGSLEKTLPILSDCMEEICGPKLDCEV